jgi:hypothetical protein
LRRLATNKKQVLMALLERKLSFILGGSVSSSVKNWSGARPSGRAAALRGDRGRLDRRFRSFDIRSRRCDALHERPHCRLPQALAHLLELLHFLGDALPLRTIVSDPYRLSHGHLVAPIHRNNVETVMGLHK